MLTTLRRTFERRGMQVLTCSEGDRALTLWEAARDAREAIEDAAEADAVRAG
jgi:ActR/RegA family two-component response regulator